MEKKATKSAGLLSIHNNNTKKVPLKCAQWPCLLGQPFQHSWLQRSTEDFSQPSAKSTAFSTKGCKWFIHNNNKKVPLCNQWPCLLGQPFDYSWLQRSTEGSLAILREKKITFIYPFGKMCMKGMSIQDFSPIFNTLATFWQFLTLIHYKNSIDNVFYWSHQTAQ